MAYDPMSPDAAAIARGVIRLLADQGYVGVKEMSLANNRRADIAAIGASGEIVIAEIKSSVADFRSDSKWPEYRPYCDRFFFAVSHTFPKDLVPEHAGLIVADGFGGAILRDCEPQKLAAARRKAMTLRFARLAAARLTKLDDPGLSP